MKLVREDGVGKEGVLPISGRTHSQRRTMEIFLWNCNRQKPLQNGRTRAVFAGALSVLIWIDQVAMKEVDMGVILSLKPYSESGEGHRGWRSLAINGAQYSMNKN